MRLSIITINYNNKEGLLKTIESVISQTDKNFEWIIIDGGSTDGSKELIELYVDYITYWVSEPDKGIYNAMNKGIKASHGDFLWFLNSGDYLYDVDVLMRVLPLLKEKDIYVGNMYCVDCVGKKWMSKKDFTPEGIIKKLTFSSFCHPSTIFNRNVFEIYGYYREDKKIASDWFFYYQSLVMGNATLEEIPFVLTVFDNNGISSIKTDSGYWERDELLKEYPQMYVLYHFWGDNYEIVHALHFNRFVFFLFRLYFFFYRKIRHYNCFPK